MAKPPEIRPQSSRIFCLSYKVEHFKPRKKGKKSCIFGLGEACEFDKLCMSANLWSCDLWNLEATI
jgi:hypothetical protein